MSYHIKLKDFECPDCSAIYMPYSADVVCPKCKKLNPVENAEYFNFAEEVLASMKTHKNLYGEYHPPAWKQGCFAEYIQSVSFSFLHLFTAPVTNRHGLLVFFL